MLLQPILRLCLCVLMLCLVTAGRVSAADQDVAADPSIKKIVLIAGPITGHPKHTHEYEKSVILLKHLLDTSPNLQGIRTEVHFHGWPEDESTLDDADTIVMISDGSDREETHHPLYVGDRLQVLEKQMQRGCGVLAFHWTTFHPSRFHDKITRWIGGYFDYETGPGPRNWYSAIQTWKGPVKLEAAHPICRGVKPFSVQEEFYYNMRFHPDDDRVTPIVRTRPPGEDTHYPVGWAVQRKDGGRGCGFTGGHFYQNWWQPDFRKLILNAIVWTAGADVPEGGVQSQLGEPIRALIVTGHQHPAHDWRKTTAALILVLEQDPRVFVDVTESVEDLASEKIQDYDLIVMNYNNWDRPGLSAAARENFVRYLKQGGGLSLIHFANGAFTNTLPNKESDWPEYRTKIVRRIWEHGKSGHDAFGPFTVEFTEHDHPITAGLESFETIDELYFRQVGDLPLTPLATAHSKVTNRDEPMAWAYKYGKANVFQTVLGHDGRSILMAGALIRRGSVWAARRRQISFDPPLELMENALVRDGSQWTIEQSLERAKGQENASPKSSSTQTPAKPQAEGRFGQGLHARAGGAFVAGRAEFREPPLTVECWAKIDSSNHFNIIAANEQKASATHWEMFSFRETGHYTVYLPGMSPDHVRSEVNICDGQWHYLAMIYEPQRVRLFVDGKQVADKTIQFNGGETVPGDLAVGSLVSRQIGCDGVIDELRISQGVREISDIPSQPFAVDARTIGLWHFDRLTDQGRFEDASPRKAEALIAAVKKKSTPGLKRSPGIGAKRPSGFAGPSRIRWTVGGRRRRPAASSAARLPALSGRRSKALPFASVRIRKPPSVMTRNCCEPVSAGPANSCNCIRPAMA